MRGFSGVWGGSPSPQRGAGAFVARQPGWYVPSDTKRHVALNQRGMGRKKCEHGRQRSKCKDCGGSGICEHGRVRSQCKDCGGGGTGASTGGSAASARTAGSGVCEHTGGGATVARTAEVFSVYESMYTGPFLPTGAKRPGGTCVSALWSMCTF